MIMEYKIKAVSEFFPYSLYGTLTRHSKKSYLFEFFLDLGDDSKRRYDSILVGDVESCVSYLLDDLGFTWFTFNKLR